eukprot:gene28312-34184_t
MRRLLESSIPTNKPSLQGMPGGGANMTWMKNKSPAKSTSPGRQSESPTNDNTQPHELTRSIFDDDVEYTSVKMNELDVSKILKASKISQARKSAAFTPYKSTRPDLLQQLNHMVEQGRKSLRVDASSEHKDHEEAEKNFMVYSTAFQVFIDESTLYQPFLASVKDAYETYASSLRQDIQLAMERLDSQVSIEEKFDHKMKLTVKEHEQKVSSLQDTIKDLKERLKKSENDKGQVELDYNRHKDGTVQMKKNYEDLKTTCALLTSSLSRMEEDYRNYQMQESNRAMELTSLRANEQKLNEEIERLQQVVQAQEQTISQMISPEQVQSLSQSVQTLTEELYHNEQTHKHLLLRYATLKHLVEESLQRVVKGLGSTEGGSEIKSITQFLSQVQDTANKYPSKSKTKSNASNDPTTVTLERLLSAKDNAHFVKMHFFEVMLDELTAYYAQVHHVQQSSGNAHAEGGEDSADGGFVSPYTHFDGSGYGIQTPSFLQYNGKVQNLSLSKVEIVTLCNELVDAKKAYDQMYMNSASRPLTRGGNAGGDGGEGGGESTTMPASAAASSQPRRRTQSVGAGGGGTGVSMISPTLVESLPLGGVSFAVFIEYYLKDKFNQNEHQSTELYYNLLDGVKRHQNTCSDCKLFSILHEEKLPFDIAYDIYDNVVSYIYEECMKEAKLILASSVGGESGAGGVGGMSMYRLSVEQVMRVTRR